MTLYNILAEVAFISVTMATRSRNTPASNQYSNCWHAATESLVWDSYWSIFILVNDSFHGGPCEAVRLFYNYELIFWGYCKPIW